MDKEKIKELKNLGFKEEDNRLIKRIEPVDVSRVTIKLNKDNIRQSYIHIHINLGNETKMLTIYGTDLDYDYA